MSEVAPRIRELCRAFHLPTVGTEAEPRFVAAGQAAALPTLAEVLELEAEDRRQRRITRLRYASKLPPGKTAATFDPTRLPPKLQHQLGELAGGGFLERSANVLAFGLPGTGKTHAACALGHRLIEAGHAVFFTPAYRLVQELLAAKRDLALPRALRKLDQFEVLILDDLGYVQQDAAEAEVLFTLLAERYERRSLMITSNLVFSQWDQIFRNPMATAAAIDRIVHHSVILEFDVASYRTEAAQQRTRLEATGSAAKRPKSRPEEPAGTKNQDDGRMIPRPEEKIRVRKRQK
jgi:DNA replication protein DnaC